MARMTRNKTWLFIYFNLIPHFFPPWFLNQSSCSSTLIRPLSSNRASGAFTRMCFPGGNPHNPADARWPAPGRRLPPFLLPSVPEPSVGTDLCRAVAKDFNSARETRQSDIPTVHNDSFSLPIFLSWNPQNPGQAGFQIPGTYMSWNFHASYSLFPHLSRLHTFGSDLFADLLTKV